jgi:epoxyqueuosine reductase
MLVDSLQLVAKMGGAHFFGVADITLARAAVLEQGGELVAGFPCAVSIGITLPRAIVNQLPNRDERAVAVSYRHEYDTVNQRLDFIASQVSGLIQEQGYQAMPAPASRRIDDQRLCGIFSHKLAAHLAGLGWIGKNCMLITPTQGPRVRWVSVLTAAPLPITGEPMEEKCGLCQECVTICPTRAFTGRPFHPDEPRAMRYDAHKCDDYFSRMKELKPDLHVCGLCLYICPYGRNGNYS